jgi:hypothetical protein
MRAPLLPFTDVAAYEALSREQKEQVLSNSAAFAALPFDWASCAVEVRLACVSVAARFKCSTLQHRLEVSHGSLLISSSSRTQHTDTLLGGELEMSIA